MKEFKTLAEAASAVETEMQKNQVLVAELKEAQVNFENAFKQASDAQQIMAQLTEQNELLKNQIEAMKAESATVDQKVAAALAGLAVPPVASVQSSELVTNKLSAKEQLAQIKDPMARAIFRRDNFDELLKNR
jgi:arginine deiminase